MGFFRALQGPTSHHKTQAWGKRLEGAAADALELAEAALSGDLAGLQAAAQRKPKGNG